MEVLGICHVDGAPVEICTFSVANDSDESFCEEKFQRQMVEHWRAVFKVHEIDPPTLLTASRDCTVHNSQVGAHWRRCAFVLQPREPLVGGLATHQQRLLAVTVGAADRLTPEELAERVRATYGATAVLHNQKLQRDRGVGGRRGGRSSASECNWCVYSPTLVSILIHSNEITDTT